MITVSCGALAFVPPFRAGGSATFIVSNAGLKSIDKSEGEKFSIGFFLAFMMLGSEAKRGSTTEIRKMDCVKG